MNKKNDYGYNICSYMSEENFKIWEENYWKNYKINLLKYFNQHNLKILNKLEIIITDRLYTERELEIIEALLLRYYSEKKVSILLEKKEVSKNEYEEILKIFSKMLEDYEL